MYFPLTIQELFLIVGISSTLFSALERLHFGLIYSIPIPILFATFAINIMALSKIWSSNDDRIKFISSKNGKESYQDINNAKRNILVTHFSKNIPTEAYIQLLFEKMSHEVSVTRILSSQVNKNDKDYQWLLQFEGKSHYIEKTMNGANLPFDIMIFDNEKVKVLFPVSGEYDHFKEGIVFCNSKVATMFKNSLERASRIN